MIIKILSWLTPRTFEPELECLYQDDLRFRVFKQIKLSILIGTLVFLSFIVLDIADSDFKYLWVRIPTVLIGITLWMYLHKRPEQTTPWIFHLGLLGIAVALIASLSMLSSADGTSYVRSYPPMMLIIAFLYGPLFAPIIPATLLGVSCIVVTVLIGISHSAPADIIKESTFILCLITIVSLFSRYQLEVFSRRSFIDKRTADLARRVADDKRQQAEQANLEKAAFLRNASHNLRQPTQALSSYSLLLERALQSQDLSSAMLFRAVTNTS